MAERTGPKPWFGCDTSGEPWRAYCEAWSHAFKRKSPWAMGQIHDMRGKDAVDALEHNIKIVKRDYRGEIDNRAELPSLLRL